MKLFSHDEILDRFGKLPEALRDAMFADINTNLMLELGKKHGLLLDQVGQLADETAYIVLGLAHPKDFVARLAWRLKIDNARATALASDVNLHIFDPIRTHLMKTHDFPDGSMPKSKPEAVLPTREEPKEPPALRQPSFAMPLGTTNNAPADEKPKEKAPMIFPQKMTAPPPPPKSRLSDPYREQVE